MLRNVFLKTLRDRRRALLFWGIGLVTLAVVMMLFYPYVRDATAIREYIEAFPEELLALFAGDVIDYTSPTGFLNSELFFLMVPVLFLVFAISFGSSTIASEEERGTLDLLLSYPLPRWRVVVEKFGAMVIATLVLAFALWLGLTISAIALDIDISIGRLAETCLSAALLGVTFGTLALAVSCVRGNRGLSMGVASALGVYAYLLNVIAPMIEWLEPFRKLSPFYYYIAADPLNNGLNLGHVAILTGLIAVFLAVALITFQRRDLAV